MNVQQYIDELNSLDMNNPGAWSPWVRYMFAILACVLVIAGGLYFKVREQKATLETEQRKETELRGEFERKQRKVAGLDAYKAQLAEMEQSFGTMLRQLPSRAEVANLLNDISQTRIASGLDENLFQPSAEVTKDFYAEIPNRIELVGGYHEMGTFVSGIAALPRIVTIEEIQVQPLNFDRNKPEAGYDSDQLKMNAVVKTYRYLDDSELEAQEEANRQKNAKGKRK